MIDEPESDAQPATETDALDADQIYDFLEEFIPNVGNEVKVRDVSRNRKSAALGLDSNELIESWMESLACESPQYFEYVERQNSNGTVLKVLKRLKTYN
ncbi:hypothetical protein H6F95_06200 [Cyanobacteria bacterium FACHB-471]|nr:hypothetical protein [Cyanobacteria bacterium FACHB-471]